jgi:hypothetical protein
MRGGAVAVGKGSGLIELGAEGWADPACHLDAAWPQQVSECEEVLLLLAKAARSGVFSASFYKQ